MWARGSTSTGASGHFEIIGFLLSLAVAASTLREVAVALSLQGQAALAKELRGVRPPIQRC